MKLMKNPVTIPSRLLTRYVTNMIYMQRFALK